MGLLQDFLGACAGEQRAASALYAALQQLGGRQVARFSRLDASEGEDAVQTVMMRIWRSRPTFVDELRESRARPQLSALKKASRRGATPRELSQALGRALSPSEHAALDPLADDAAARKYLTTAIRNALRDRLRKRRPATELTAEPATPPEPTCFDAQVPRLLLALHHDFVAWANGRSPGSGDRYAASLQQLRRAPEGGARAVVAAESPTLDADALRRAAGTRRRHWSRARTAFYDYVTEERRFQRHERALVPDVLRLFDSEYRIRKRSAVSPRQGVRKPGPLRPTGPPGGPP